MKKEITYDVLIMHKSLTLVASTTTQSYIDLQHVAILQMRNTIVCILQDDHKNEATETQQTSEQQTSS